MTGIRIGLIAFGVLVLGLGGWALVAQVEPRAYIGILIWMAGALVIHDGIIAPLTALARLLARRAGRRVPTTALAVVQGALVLAVILSGLVVPEILKQRIGSANPTILPRAYAPHLAIAVAVLLVVAVGFVVVPLVRQRRRAV